MFGEVCRKGIVQCRESEVGIPWCVDNSTTGFSCLHVKYVWSDNGRIIDPMWDETYAIFID